MTVKIEKDGPVWTVIHSGPEARNGMDPVSAQELHDGFIEFEEDPDAYAAVFWGEGGAQMIDADRSVLSGYGVAIIQTLWRAAMA